MALDEKKGFVESLFKIKENSQKKKQKCGARRVLYCSCRFVVSCNPRPIPNDLLYLP